MYIYKYIYNIYINNYKIDIILLYYYRYGLQHTCLFACICIQYIFRGLSNSNVMYIQNLQ